MSRIQAWHESSNPSGMRLVFLVGLVLAVPGHAAAQYLYAPAPAAPTVSNGLLRIQLHLESPRSRASMYVVADSDYSLDRQPAALLGYCTADCQLIVPSGDYRVRLEDSDGSVSDSGIRLLKSEILSVGPPNRGTADLGLTLGIAGTAAAASGLLMLLAGMVSTSGEDEPDWTPPVAGVGVVSLLVGSFITPFGWGMYATNRNMRLNEYEFKPQRPAPHPGFGVTPTKSAFRMGFEATF